jgi:hypothetical protein
MTSTLVLLNALNAIDITSLPANVLQSKMEWDVTTTYTKVRLGEAAKRFEGRCVMLLYPRFLTPDNEGNEKTQSLTLWRGS